MKLKKVIGTTIIILTIINILFFIFVDFNLKTLITNIIIEVILIYFIYRSLKNYPFQKFKWTKNIIVIAILGYAAFFSMIIGFTLLAYSILQQDKSLTLISAIIIAIFFLNALLLFVFSLYIKNKRAFKIYLVTIFIWAIITGLTGILMKSMQSTALLTLLFALAICLLLFIFIFPVVAIISSKKKK